MILTIEAGRLPVVALGLTLTWGVYAYLKKSLPIGPNEGFFLEVLLLFAARARLCALADRRGEKVISCRDFRAIRCCCWDAAL